MLLKNFYKGKKVLITGSTGFKGTWLCLALKRLGAITYGYSLEPPTNPSLFELVQAKDIICNRIGDVRDFESLKKAFDDIQPEIVFHLAAQPIVLDSYALPRYTYEVNVMGTVNVLECIRLCHSVRSFVNITTDKVYENKDLLNHPFREDEKLDGYDPYSNSKSCSELVTHCYKKSFFSNLDSPSISTARAGNVIGGGDFSPHRIMVDAVNAALSGKEIFVRNSKSIRPYQFVLEPLFCYMLLAAEQFDKPCVQGSYNIGPDSCDAVSTGELVKAFCKKWGGDLKWLDATDPSAPHEASYLELDNSLFKKTFKWRPVLHINEAIDWIVDWARSYKNNEDMLAKTNEQIDCFAERFSYECNC